MTGSLRVREQIDTNLLGLHVVAGSTPVGEGLGQYTNALAARSEGLTGASARAVSFVTGAGGPQSGERAVLPGRFTVVALTAVAMLALTALLRRSPD